MGTYNIDKTATIPATTLVDKADLLPPRYPVIFSTRSGNQEVIFYTRADSLPAIFHTRKYPYQLWNMPETVCNNNVVKNRSSHIIDTIPSITLGYSFNQPINNLPEKISTLIFFYSNSVSNFNHPVNNLPNSLKRLFFHIILINQLITYLIQLKNWF
jgi:hypothetical protein